MNCPANQKICDGQTYFDTYKCQPSVSGDVVTGYWIPVATTACEGPSVDSGVVYPSYDAGFGAALDSITTDTN
jgi:hypothetical protein